MLNQKAVSVFTQVANNASRIHFFVSTIEDIVHLTGWECFFDLNCNIVDL